MISAQYDWMCNWLYRADELPLCIKLQSMYRLIEWSTYSGVNWEGRESGGGELADPQK